MRPRRVPRFPSRLHRSMVWIMLGGLPLMIVAILVGNSIPHGNAITLLGAIVYVASVLGLGWHAEARSLATIRAHRGLLCVRCCYPLDTLAHDGLCPECGAPYQRECVRAEWVMWFPALRKEPWIPNGSGAGGE
ncbi:MAG: hypothetical protein IT437_03385 [Phycisphaerales bacterium]|nr:hypothetical protein [Phycisphaerales bacterium]